MYKPVGKDGAKVTKEDKQALDSQPKTCSKPFKDVLVEGKGAAKNIVAEEKKQDVGENGRLLKPMSTPRIEGGNLVVDLNEETIIGESRS